MSLKQKQAEVQKTMAKKDKTLWQLILDIISFIFTRKRKQKEEKIKIEEKQKEKLKEVVKDLDDFYHKTDDKQKQKQNKDKDVKDISNRLNNRF